MPVPDNQEVQPLIVTYLCGECGEYIDPTDPPDNPDPIGGSIFVQGLWMEDVTDGYFIENDTKPDWIPCGTGYGYAHWSTILKPNTQSPLFNEQTFTINNGDWVEVDCSHGPPFSPLGGGITLNFDSPAPTVNILEKLPGIFTYKWIFNENTLLKNHLSVYFDVHGANPIEINIFDIRTSTGPISGTKIPFMCGWNGVFIMP